MLGNLNRLAGTAQDSRPVNQTLEYFLEKIGSAPIAGLRQRMVQRLIRMKTLDAARLQGRFLVLIDGSGYLVFGSRHCDDCLTQRHGETTLYMHQVLEAKLLGPAGTVVSIATEFIDNQRRHECPGRCQLGTDQAGLRVEGGAASAGTGSGGVPPVADLPGRRRVVCLRGRVPGRERLSMRLYLYLSSLDGCRPSGRTSRGCCSCAPSSVWNGRRPQGVRQVYRWVNGLHYTDSDGRDWTVNAMECTETNTEGKKTEWSWVTSLDVSRKTVVEVATHGGRERWRAENEGFNTQKNSGLNLEHAYSHTCWAACYFLLQIAHLLLQLMEKGSLLRQLAQEQEKRTAVELFGSLKNMAQRLLESLYWHWSDEAPDRTGARSFQIRLDSS